MSGEANGGTSSGDAGSAGGAPARHEVVVVGGGLVGLSCAWFLAEAGVEVALLERGRVGGGASRGNAGLVCPALADPLPAPGLVRHGLAGLLRADSPLYLDPRALPRLAAFLARFARRTTPGAYAAGVAALAQLGRMTFGAYDELAAAGALGESHDDGYLFACATRGSATAARNGLVRMADQGYAAPPGPLLEADELRRLEPSLSAAAQAGFVQPGERWLDPSGFVDALATRLRERGVAIIEQAEVTGLRDDGPSVSLETSAGPTEAGQVVIASGVWSDRLCRMLGLRLGLVPGKGYSFAVEPAVMPARAIYLADAHVVATPIGDRLRLAGTIEFDGSVDRFNDRRVRAIAGAASRYLSGIDWQQRTAEWVGPRPMTPDGLPMIGRLPGRSRVLVAAGHNMLGLTLAPSTGRVIAALVTGRAPGIDLAPFAPGRFAHWWSGWR